MSDQIREGDIVHVTIDGVTHEQAEAKRRRDEIDAVWDDTVRDVLRLTARAEDAEAKVSDLREFADLLSTFHRGRKIDADIVIDKLHAALGKGGA
jgi:hypothetical protein